ncbi:MAG: CRISPR system precrRNA processing endoribonuclease RAMP protein Cas6 [Hydrogenophaga sp.]
MGEPQSPSLKANAMQTLVTQLCVTVEATRTLAWPHFAGSRIRGAFGRALRQAACITGQPQCDGCAVRAQCAYGVVFDPAAPAQALHPSFQNGLPAYLIQVPPLGARQLRPGDTVCFSVQLLAGDQSQHRLVEHVMPDAVNHHLFKPGDCTLQAIECRQLPAVSMAIDADAVPTLRNIQLHWLTPMRLQHLGKPLFRPRDLSAAALIGAAWRRYLQWCQLTRQTPNPPQPPLDAARQCTLDTQAMHWHDISRYSNTQQKHLPLGGLLGHAVLTGPDSALKTLLPLLRLGEQLHIGKETVFGLGRYHIHPLRPTATATATPTGATL